MVMVRTAYLAVLAGLLLSLTPVGAEAAPAAPTVQIRMIDDAFQPKTAETAIGLGGFSWSNVGVRFHTATTDDPPRWLDIALDEGQSGGIQPPFVGTFDYDCVYHPLMVGTLRIAPTINPPGGTIGDTLTMTLAIQDPTTSGFAFDVERRRNRNDWVPVGRFATTTVALMPKRSGRFNFHARLVDTVTEGASDWSPMTTFTIT